MSQENLAAGLYLVATPIGTARDITLRALDILKSADVIAAEDTRNTRRLLDIHGVSLGSRALIPYHDHNGAAQRPKILETLREGGSVALVSDAGTPMVADPGFHLVQDVVEAGHSVFTAPGASSVMAAICVSGLPTDRFLFEGFLPPKKGAKVKTLETLKSLQATLIFFESPKRIHDSLILMNETLGGDRSVAVCRELTKKFESVYRGSLAKIAAEAPDTIPAKGEFVVVLGPPSEEEISDEKLILLLKAELETQRLKDASNKVAADCGVSRKRVYDLGLKLKG